MYDLDDLEADGAVDELPDFMKPDEPTDDDVSDLTTRPGSDEDDDEDQR
jgi:hypothetical protein